MKRKPRLTAIAVAAISASLLAAAPATAAQADASPVASAAKAKKKKKKRKKGRPAAPAPVVPGGSPSAPGGPSGPTDPNACDREDAFEQDDTLATATALPFPGSYDRIFRYRCPNDSDVFKVEIPVSKWFRFAVDPGDGFDVALRVYNGDGSVLVTWNWQGPGGEEWIGVSNTAGAPGPITYYVEVTSLTPEAGGAYDAVGVEF